MKILELKIISPKQEVIRRIEFKENGVSFILGDILEPKDNKKTSNSLGKSLLLKFIDYIYGANIDNKVVPKELDFYELEAIVLHKEERFEISRKLKNSENIKVNDIEYTLTKYKEFFEIDRNLFHKQIILQPRQGLISYQKNPEESDMINFLKLLGLKDVIQKAENIYLLQNDIKKLAENKKQMILILNENDKLIEEKIFLLGKEIEKLEENTIKISAKIKNMQITEIKEDIIKEYQNTNIKFKKVNEEIFSNNLEIQRMKKFLEDYDNIDISSQIIFKLYNKAKIEVPALVKRDIEEVEKFHRNVYSDRKNILLKKIEDLKKFNEINKNSKIELKEILDHLGLIISENEIYKENIELYEKYSQELRNKKYKQGQFSQVENILKKIEVTDNNLTISFSELQKSFLSEENNEIIKDIQNFVYEFTKAIYECEEETLNSYFKLEVRKKDKKNRPFKLDIKIDYDRGEGVGQVKKIMIDILLLKFNKILDFFIQDSCCYSGGVDPRQVTSILLEINKLSLLLNKQAIISINRYQVNQDENIIKLLNNNKAIELSENNKLLKIDFK